MTKSHIDVVLCANERYFHGLFCAIGSALRSLEPDYCMAIHVIDAGLAESSRQSLEQLVTGCGSHTIDWLPAPSSSFDGLENTGYHRSAYYRLALPEILDVERVIYLDADTLVFGCLGKLWEQGLAHDDPVLAVQDWETPTLAEDSPALAKALGLEDAGGYFNSGLLVLRLDLLRKETFTARVCAMLGEHGALARFADQSALNWHCAGRWHKLEPRWNLPAWAFDGQDDNRLPAICHFTNHAPWLKRHYSPSQALFERMACELGLDLPMAEKGLGQAACRAFMQWLLAPGRAIYQWIQTVRHRLSGDAACSSACSRLACYWWTYFMGGPRRVIRYRRRIREIRSGSFQPFSTTSA